MPASAHSTLCAIDEKLREVNLLLLEASDDVSREAHEFNGLLESARIHLGTVRHRVDTMLEISRQARWAKGKVREIGLRIVIRPK